MPSLFFKIRVFIYSLIDKDRFISKKSFGLIQKYHLKAMDNMLIVITLYRDRPMHAIHLG